MSNKYSRYSFVDFSGRPYIHNHGLPFNGNVEYIPHPNIKYPRTIIKYSQPHEKFMNAYKLNN